MGRIGKIVVLLLLAVLLLSGCMMRTVQEMYRPPRRSQDYLSLQSAMDAALSGLEYCAPLTGEHQQTVQMADLNGDGEPEYLLFAKGDSEKPLKVLIFGKTGDSYALLEVIEGQGSAFEKVEYVDMDGQPGLELVLGRQVSDQLLRSVSVYTFARGNAEQLMASNYSKFLTCDLDDNARRELMILQPGEAETDKAVAALYRFVDGTMERSREVELSGPADAVKRIMVSRLHGDVPAVYIASTVDENAIITDVFALKDGYFSNISFSNESGTSVQTLRNYYVYANDIDDDGVLELPSLITMAPVTQTRTQEQQYLIRWFAMDITGGEVDKGHTFHNFQEGWYLELDESWANRISVEPAGNTCVFYLWDEQHKESQPFLTVFTLTAANREEQAIENNRFPLHKAEGIIYAAKLEGASAALGITQEDLIRGFHPIQKDWYTGET